MYMNGRFESPLAGQLPSPTNRKPRAKSFDLAVLVVLPWLIFSLVVGLYAFAFEDFQPLVYALVVASVLLGFLFLSVGSASSRPGQVALGMLVLTAVGVALPVGSRVQNRYMAPFWAVDSGAVYAQVDSSSPAALYTDSSVVSFRSGTTIDQRKSVGYMRQGIVYCVAPMMSISESASVPEFWAVGRNCCGLRGSFDCGDANLTSNSTRRISGVRWFRDAETFTEAVRMAVSTYGMGVLLPHQSVVLLRPTADPPQYKLNLWTEALATMAAASGVHLAGSIGAGLLLVRGMLR